MRNLSNLKVSFVAGTLALGGAERQLFYILQALCQAGASPRLLSFSRGEFWEEKIRALEVPITWVGEPSSRLGRLRRVLQEVRKHPPDILQSQHFYTNAYVGLTARLMQLSGIGAMRNNGSTEVSGCGPLGGWLNLHCPPMIAANSEVAVRYAVTRGVSPSRLYFLPNVVDTEWFRPSERWPEEPVTLVAVGRLVRQKRMDRFISMVHRLRNEFGLNVTGWIVGSGRAHEDLRAESERQARSLGLSPEILQFRGEVSDMRSVYRKAAVCVLTSDFEGTPNVLLEAMASGLPVVATQVGGVSEIVQHGRTGFLAKADDRDGLVAGLVELVKNPELRLEMGRRARAFVQDSHSLQRLPAYLGGLYESALPAAGLSPRSRRRPTWAPATQSDDQG